MPRRRRRSGSKWIPAIHASGRWRVIIPAKWADNGGKQKDRYFDTKSDAEKFIADTIKERAVHGQQAVSLQERRWIGYLQEHVGDLRLLPAIVDHWKRTGEKLSPTSAEDAVTAFSDLADKEFSNHRTLNDIKERLNKFSDHFGSKLLHEISPAEIESFLSTFSAGWSRWSVHKRLKPFYKLAKRRRWISADPMEEIPPTKVPAPERRIYSPDEFQAILWECERNYKTLLPYVVLSGFCFLRTSELVRMYEAEKVLRWEHILFKDGLIHVPPGVAKSTRNADGDERLIPLNKAAKGWLATIQKDSGDCVPHSAKKFGELWREMMGKADVSRIDNGLRHSAISYALAADPELGVAMVSRWAGNSEKTVRKYYFRLLKPEQGKLWFAVNKWSDVGHMIEAQQKWREEHPGEEMPY